MVEIRAILFATLVLSTTVTSADAQLFYQAGKIEQEIEHRKDELTPCSDPRISTEDRIQHCTRIVGTGSRGSDDAELILASLYRIQGNYELALSRVNAVLGRLTDSAYSRMNSRSQPRVNALESRSTIYAQMGRFGDAMADADEIIRISTSEEAAYNDRCWVRAVAAKELEQALADCNHALSVKANFAGALDSRGMVGLKLGHFQDALADYDAALEKNSRMTTSRFARGVVKLRMGDIAGGNADIADATRESVDISKEMAGYGVSP